ncbi:MAG: molybdate ABC transporter permease subunit [Candidatus Kapaibacteriota bacterium]
MKNIQIFGYEQGFLSFIFPITRFCMPEFAPFLVSLRLAATTVALLLCTGVPVAYFLAFSRSRIKPLLESLVSLPIALPPTVLGFYWLYALGQESLVGAWLQSILAVNMVFSFSGLVLGSVLYSLPFMVQPVKSGFEAIPSEILDSARLDGASAVQVFLRVTAPLARRSLLTGCALVFVHALGEFGIVMMIGGNIAGETRTASIALYDAVQAMDYAAAHFYALCLLLVALGLTLPVFWRFRD